jgi:phage tail protein, P2 protein I family
MSRTIYDVSLIELLPPNLRNDSDIAAASKTVDPKFWTLAGLIGTVKFFVDIDNAPSNVIDMLAIEMNADFYDQTLPLKNRRDLVKNAYFYKYYKGTALAVKQIVTDIYSAANTEEWFQYGGDPGYFRVTTEAELPDVATLDRIFTAIAKVKNVRSWLEAFAALKHVGETHYLGTALYERKHQIIGG